MGHVGRNSSRKRTNKIPCPAALLALTSPSPTNRAGGLLGTPAITTIAMATWDLSAGGGAEKREAIMPGEACKNIVSLFLPATAGHRCLPSKYPQPISRSQIYSKGQRRFPRIHQKLPRKGQYLPITQNAGSQDARACS